LVNLAPLDKLTAGDAAADDLFGISVAIDGDTVVIGAYGDRLGSGWGAGSAYVFRTTDGGATYDQVAKLTASDAASMDYFGWSVAIYGDTIVVGANQQYNGGSGSAYVFHTSDGGATYGQVAKLTAADGAAYDYFGTSVAIDGSTIVVGAYGKDDSTGAVYVFRTSDGGATYAQVAKLSAADAASGDRFGVSVAIDGSTIVVGADEYKEAAYVFHTSDGGATYVQVAKLTASDGASWDYFGRSVAIDGSAIVVGAYGKDSWTGAVYVFRTTDGGATYDQVARLTAAGTTSFGRSVAIAGATIVVGSGGEAAYIFHTSDGGATYVDLSKLMADDRGDRRSLQAVSAGDYFGYSVAIDGATVVVGAYNDGNTGPVDGSGSAYVFGANLPTPQPTTSRPTTPEIDYAPSAAPSEAPTFATYIPTAEGAELGSCETYNAPKYEAYGVCDGTTTQCSQDSDCDGVHGGVGQGDCDSVRNDAQDDKKSSYTCGVTELACMGAEDAWEEPWDKGDLREANYNTHDWSAAKYSRMRSGCCVCELGCDHMDEDGDKGSICLANVGTGDRDTVKGYIKFAVGVLVNTDPNDLLLEDFDVPLLDGCVNDDSTEDEDGDTCTDWYDEYPDGCGDYDDEDFTAATQCCACKRFSGTTYAPTPAGMKSGCDVR
jgi:hypothetical protein